MIRWGQAASVVGAVALAVVGACTDDDAGDTAVLVLAAASLADVFVSIETAFEADHPTIDIEISVGGSNALRVQVENGAPAAVIALADDVSMQALVDGGFVESPRPFASNRVVLAVPAGNPGDIASIADFERAELLLGTCAPEVPCGRYAAAVFDGAGVNPSLDTEEPDVRALVTKLVAGELDGGLVYATDALGHPDDLATIPLPEATDVRAEYPIAIITDGPGSRDVDAPNPSSAALFVEFVVSERGRAILADAGFGPP